MQKAYKGSRLSNRVSVARPATFTQKSKRGQPPLVLCFVLGICLNYHLKPSDKETE